MRIVKVWLECVGELKPHETRDIPVLGGSAAVKVLGVLVRPDLYAVVKFHGVREGQRMLRVVGRDAELGGLSLVVENLTARTIRVDARVQVESVELAG